MFENNYYTQHKTKHVQKIAQHQGFVTKTKGIGRLPYIVSRAMRSLVVQGDIIEGTCALAILPCIK